ncbi:hypothetical protein [Limnohabitans sp. B9-3]|uniref:hypothetical protein n=1 Tax=Limnohabitans sp. B9-3 TaxID=1100707 RepID=UPI001303F70B|nr:hypothetical protein [Limnohabitans sp. B9-3]
MNNMLAAEVRASFEFFEHSRQKSLRQNHAVQGTLAATCSHSLRLRRSELQTKKSPP